jgi:hypothetical protein
MRRNTIKKGPLARNRTQHDTTSPMENVLFSNECGACPSCDDVRVGLAAVLPKNWSGLTLAFVSHHACTFTSRDTWHVCLRTARGKPSPLTTTKRCAVCQAAVVPF